MLQTPSEARVLASGTWRLDTAHSGMSFDIRFLGLANFKGRFDRFDASLVVADQLAQLSGSVEIDSINTGLPGRDSHLLAPSVLGSEAHPTLTFHSTDIRLQDGRYQVAGVAIFHGITKALSLDVEFTGLAVHPGDGKLRAGFAANTELRRSDFGIDFNIPVNPETMALGDTVNISIEALFLAPE